MRRCIAHLLIASFLTMPSFVFGQDDSWQLIKESENLTIYGRLLEDTKFKEIKVHGKIKSSLSELVLALEDVKAQEEWVIRTIEAKQIDNMGVGKFHFYLSTDMPFPIKDRDLVVYYERTQNVETKVVTTISYATPDKLDPISGFIRIPQFDSKYTLTPHNTGWISIEYVMGVDPGGVLPAWLVNLAATVGPVNTMKSLYKIIESGRYKGLNTVGIEEL